MPHKHKVIICVLSRAVDRTAVVVVRCSCEPAIIIIIIIIIVVMINHVEMMFHQVRTYTYTTYLTVSAFEYSFNV
jgi:hypothetical protein